MILLYSVHFWYVKHVKSHTVSYIFLKIEQEGRKKAPFSSISASDPLTLILGRIWTTQILDPDVHQAVPSISSTTWQRNAPFSTRTTWHQLEPCMSHEAHGHPARVVTLWGLRAKTAFTFASQVTESSWMNSKSVLSVLCSQKTLKFIKGKAPGMCKWPILSLPAYLQAGDSALPGVGRSFRGSLPLQDLLKKPMALASPAWQRACT